MNKYELIFRTTEIIIQLVLVIFAGLALSVWKREVRGKDKYKLARELLAYIKEIRFMVYSKDESYHQIFLNDILVNKEKFYEYQLQLIGKEDIYFDQSIWGLFSHINVRADIFMPKRPRLILEELCPVLGRKVVGDKNQYTYIKLAGIKPAKFVGIESDKNFASVIWQIYDEKLTVEAYFRKWEGFIVELQKIV